MLYRLKLDNSTSNAWVTVHPMHYNLEVFNFRYEDVHGGKYTASLLTSNRDRNTSLTLERWMLDV